MPDARVSAVILNWNGGSAVARCLEALRRQTGPVRERIVVDNGSTDGSTEVLVRDDPALQVIRNPANRGFAVAANQGIARATGDWILLLNQDVVLEPDYVARLVAAAQRGGRIGSVTGKLLRLEPGTAGSPAIVDSTGHVLYRNGWAANRGEGRPDAGWEQGGEVFGVSAAAALYRGEMLRDISTGQARPFDERFFAYIEDVDLDWRARWLGWKAWYEPAIAWHERGGSGVRRHPLVLQHILKNRVLLVANNDLLPAGLFRLPGVLLFTVMAAAQFTFEQPSAALGLVKLLPLLPESLERRSFLRRRRILSARELGRWLQPFSYGQAVAGRLQHGRDRLARVDRSARTVKQ